MKVVLANDHGGVELALRFKKHMISRGISVEHLGVDDEKTSVDYTDMAIKAVEEYKKGGYDFGVLICGTGIGISIAANKHKGIVCALPQNIYAATMTREHNGANFVAFGGRIDYSDDPIKMLDAFLDTPESSEERHVRRRAFLFK